MDKIYVSEIYHMSLIYIFYVVNILCNFIIHQSQLG
jgi:hypothetical protein